MQGFITKYKNIIYYIVVVLLFILGIFLRTRWYIINNVFEDDQCRLVLTMLNKNLLQMFLPLGDAQSAPPLFMFISKILAELFGYREYVLKFIPYAASIASIVYFYKFVSSYFTKKFSIVISLVIFVLGRALIDFSSIFKQYSSDVLICLICLYYFSRIDVKKHPILLSILVVIFPLLSLPSVFFIAALFIKNIKKPGFAIIPFVITMVLYFVFNLNPSRADINTFFPEYWNDGFLKLSFMSFIHLILVNLKFYFMPNSLSFFELVLFIWGVVLCFLDKTKTRGTSRYMLIVLGLIFLAALLHLYPLSGRVGLYAINLFILFIVKPFDTYSYNKPAFWCAAICIILGFCQYDIKACANMESYTSFSPQNLMLILKEKFDPEKDIIIINSASASSYLFYSGKNNFYTDNVRLMDINRDDIKNSTLKYLNQLEKNRYYWFYFVKDYNKSQVYPYVFGWLSTKDIIYSYNERNSYLFYIRN